MKDCEMHRDCAALVTHIDEKGFVYCTSHGVTRRSHCRCRKLRAAEIKQLRNGELIKSY